MDPISSSMDDTSYQPSFFELVAQDQLRDLLGPVLRYVTSIFAQHHPRYLLKLLNRHDELFALMMFFIERYYLKTWEGSFAENFYGLRRRRRELSKPVHLPGSTNHSKAMTASDRLSKRQVRLSLFFLVALPYLRAKAVDLYEKLGGGSINLLEDEPQARTQVLDPHSEDSHLDVTRKRLLSIYKLFFPYLNAAYELSRVIFSIRYLFDKSPYWSACQALMGIEMRRIGADDYHRMRHNLVTRKVPPLSRDPLTGHKPSWFTIVRRLLVLTSNRVFESLKIVLPSSIMIFKFFEWWYSSSNTSRYRPSTSGSETQFPPIQPPVPLKAEKTGVLGDGKALTKPIPQGHCPLCRSKLANSTALPSGWVYCYKCVHAYVVQFQRCPVTLYPTSLVDLRKIIG